MRPLVKGDRKKKENEKMQAQMEREWNGTQEALSSIPAEVYS